jgi:hypothetical protein
MNRISFRYRQIDHLPEQILLSQKSRQQQPHPGGEDRERITRARQAAEALFTAKRPVSAPSVPDSAPADQSARKSRVLQITSPAVPEPETPIAAEPPISPVPASQVARIRTWVKYGMTVAQVAEIYGIAGGDVGRILSNL